MILLDLMVLRCTENGLLWWHSLDDSVGQVIFRVQIGYGNKTFYRDTMGIYFGNWSLSTFTVSSKKWSLKHYMVFIEDSVDVCPNLYIISKLLLWGVFWWNLLRSLFCFGRVKFLDSTDVYFILQIGDFMSCSFGRSGI